MDLLSLLTTIAILLGAAASVVAVFPNIRRTVQSDREQAEQESKEELRDLERRLRKEKDKERRSALLKQEKELRERYERRLRASFRDKEGNLTDDWREAIFLSRERLVNEASRLSARSSSTLAYGITTAFAGILILLIIVFVFPPNAEIKSTADFLVHFGPRITVVLIVEVIATFFLRMYAKNERDISRNKNEITNLELRLAAGLMRVRHSTSLADISMELAREERNFIVNRNEKAIPLDKNKAAETASDLAEKILEKFSKGSSEK